MSAKNSKDGVAQEPAGGETLAMRFLIDDPDKGWRVISAKRVLAAQRGELLMPELANRAIRVAYADVAVRNGRPVALRSLEITEWCLDTEGRVDQATLMSRIIERLDQSADKQQLEMGNRDDPPSKADLDAIRSALRFPRLPTMTTACFRQD